MRRISSEPSINGVAHALNGMAKRSALDELQALTTRRPPSKAAIAAWMRRSLSKQGVLLADPWRTPEAALLLSSISSGLDAHCENASRRRLERICKVAAKQAVGDGFLVAEIEGADEVRRGLLRTFDAALAEEFRSFGKRLLGGSTRQPVDKKKPPGFVDEEARIAVLRREWSPNSTAAAVDFRRFDCELALHLDGERIAAGPFETQIARNGLVLDPAGPWETVCHSADKDGEYLELAVPLADGVILDRHFYVARRAPIVWMVDVVKAKESSHWDWQARWSGASPAKLRGEAAHRGQHLMGVPTPAALLPVSSPSDPFAAGGVRVALDGGRFDFAQTSSGRRMVAAFAWTWSNDGPLVLEPWRRLTVTQDGALVPTDEAFAFRVAAGGRQCVFFRSLVHPRRHAFLGCQTFDETIIGEFNRKGDVVPWMRIE